jgi:ATP/maltotriose-dependent transcriptional regulator MalT
MINPLASLHAMQGDFEIADEYLRAANETLHALGHRDASVSHHEVYVRLLAGEPERAERLLRAGVETLAAMSDGRMLATTTALLAQAVYAQGRLDEADALCARTAATAAEDDILTQVIWRGVRARTLPRAGRCDEAKSLAREAVALVASTDLHSYHGDAMLDLAEVLAMCGCAEDSDSAVRSGLTLYELKGNSVAAARARSVLGNRSGGT